MYSTTAETKADWEIIGVFHAIPVVITNAPVGALAEKLINPCRPGVWVHNDHGRVCVQKEIKWHAAGYTAGRRCQIRILPI